MNDITVCELAPYIRITTNFNISSDFIIFYPAVNSTYIRNIVNNVSSSVTTH